MGPDDNRISDELRAQAREDWPVGVKEWEERARSVLARDAFDWISGGAGEEATLRDNRAAFERVRLRPRSLTNTASRNLTVELFDTPSTAPFMLAPIGGQTVAHKDGEVAVARAAKATGVPMLISQAASHSMEDIAKECNDVPYWYQLYMVNDREVVASLVRRAEACGARALVFTVDTAMVGWRDRDLRNGYVPFLEDEGIRQYTSDPVFRSRLAKTPESDPKAAGAAVMQMFPHPSLSWDDLSWLRDQTSLPIVVKGVLRGDDAQRAMKLGVDGIIVSNHGGRQLDGAVAALDALPEVRDAVGPDSPVLMDSGIRRGSDVVKAIALGADAVLLGRPFIYGLAVGGEQGVEHVVTTLKAEIDLAFVLAGVAGVSDLDRSFVAPS